MKAGNRFTRRIDATPLTQVSAANLVKRIEYLDAELSELAGDYVHVGTHCHGAEQAKHFAQIAKEREAAEHKRTVYGLELSSRSLMKGSAS